MKKTKAIDMHRLTVEEFHKAPKQPLVVVVDNVRSAYNVGSIFRTADAFRIEKIYLCGITACPPNTEIHKTALGGEDSVDWEYAEDTKKVVEKLHREGYTVYAVEQAEGSTSLTEFMPTVENRIHNRETEPEKRAIIMGNEVKGVQQEVVDMCDGCIEIPQWGTKHSLNVSVAAGIVIWQLSNDNCQITS